MSGTAGVSNTFANAVTATGAQLDANYTTIVAYINDPTNRNNYAADGATTNTVNITFSPPIVGGYTAGLEITFKAGATNNGGVVVNANGIGNASLFKRGATSAVALTGGEMSAGDIVKAVYDGTHFQAIGITGGYGTCTLTLTGCNAVVTGTAVYSIANNAARISVPAMSGTSTVANCTVLGLPAAITPISNHPGLMAFVQDNSATPAASRIDVLNTGQLTLYNGQTTTFTAANVKGLADGAELSWILS